MGDGSSFGQSRFDTKGKGRATPQNGDILALDLQIEMQIIVMYLSSQVARLRRFLDGDRTFEDYPQPKFPVHPDIELQRQ